jgi:hypothetical protein
LAISAWSRAVWAVSVVMCSSVRAMLAHAGLQRSRRGWSRRAVLFARETMHQRPEVALLDMQPGDGIAAAREILTNFRLSRGS